jgi:hypothetical protein
MYKEKCEELEKEVARLRAELAAQPFVRVDRGGSTAIVHHAGKDQPTAPSQAAGVSLDAIQDREELYAWIKARAAADPGILELLASKPEIRVKVERPVLQLDGGTLRGKLALLIHEGFFDEAKTASAAYTELADRRKCKTAKPNVYRECDLIAGMGFLVGEGNGYRAVPEMKKSITKG